MTAERVLVLSCDQPDCIQTVTAVDRESVRELRRRAARENGWETHPSFRQGGHTDLCRWHR